MSLKSFTAVEESCLYIKYEVYLTAQIKNLAINRRSCSSELSFLRKQKRSILIDALKMARAKISKIKCLRV